MTDPAKNLLRHPDENLLAALAENTLMPRERQEILDHLATCRHCRDAVFLAQEAASGAAAYQSPELKTSAGSGFRARLSAWKPVWALAVIALASVVASPWLLTHKRQRPPSAAIQLAAKQPEPQEPAVSANTPVESPQAFASAGRTEEGKSLQKSTRENSQMHSTQSEVSAKKVGPERAYNKQRSFSKGELEPRGSLSAQFEQGPAASAGAVGGSAGGVVNGLVSAAPAMDGPAIQTGAVPSAANAPKPAPQSMGVIGGLRAASQPAPTPSLQYFSRNPADRKIAGPLQANFRITTGVVERCRGTDCVERPLPAGRQAISVASSGRTAMALDSDGELFVSNNEGDNWTTVDKQWTGKAQSIGLTGVDSMPTLKTSGESARDKAQSMNDRVSSSIETEQEQTAPVFALINDLGETWISVDRGATWTPRKEQ